MWWGSEGLRGQGGEGQDQTLHSMSNSLCKKVGRRYGWGQEQEHE